MEDGDDRAAGWGAVPPRTPVAGRDRDVTGRAAAPAHEAARILLPVVLTRPVVGRAPQAVPVACRVRGRGARGGRPSGERAAQVHLPGRPGGPAPRTLLADKPLGYSERLWVVLAAPGSYGK
ncbi:hypothetical protein [Streptomyces sp. NPDC047841]|uniref:hypothetical protein n=1 Tax=Streptomyces sp. NPDC047841 TaxID=3154708 RepID=UPI0034557119